MEVCGLVRGYSESEILSDTRKAIPTASDK